MQAQYASSIGESFIVGGKNAAFDGRHVFDRVKAESGSLADRADRLSMIFRPDGVRCILDNRQVVLVGYLVNSGQVTRLPGHVDRQNCLRPLGDSGGNLAGVYIERIRLDID